MKKLFSLTAAVIFLVFGVKSSFGQSGCVSCNNNVIDTLNFSSAIGTDNTATGNRSFAGGIYSEANGSASFAFGNRAIAEGATSAVIGQFARVYTSTAMVFGAGFDIDNPLINSEYYSLMIGFGSTKSTLFVGPSVGVNNTGKIGIGNVTEPQAKLHIRADENEHATLRLEATGSDKHSRLYFSDDIYLTASPQNNLSFTLPENNNLIFEYGNVGIGTNDPQAMLHVNGSMIVGDNNTASESYSFAGGSNTQATGENSLLLVKGPLLRG